MRDTGGGGEVGSVLGMVPVMGGAETIAILRRWIGYFILFIIQNPPNSPPPPTPGDK